MWSFHEVKLNVLFYDCSIFSEKLSVVWRVFYQLASNNMKLVGIPNWITSFDHFLKAYGEFLLFNLVDPINNVLDEFYRYCITPHSLSILSNCYFLASSTAKWDSFEYQPLILKFRTLSSPVERPRCKLYATVWANIFSLLCSNEACGWLSQVRHRWTQYYRGTCQSFPAFWKSTCTDRKGAW